MSQQILKWVSKFSDEQIRQVQAQSQSIWGDGLELEARIQNLFQLLNFKNGEYLHFAGLVNESNEIVCSCKMYTLFLKCGSQILKTHGFGAVFTPEQYRKKGYAGQMIKTALDEAKQKGYQASLLFSDIGTSYYQKFGYKELPSFASEIAVDDIMDSEIELSTSVDRTRGIEILDKSWPELTLEYHYTADTYELYRMRNSPQGLDLVLWHGERQVGFVHVAVHDKGLYLKEFALLDAHYWMAVWSFVKNYARSMKKSKVIGWWPAPIELPGTTRKYRGGSPAMVTSLSPDFDLSAVDLSQAHVGPLGYF